MMSIGSGRQLDAGNFSHGGTSSSSSSSSSTLSPLAPPFTVDRPFQKPKENPVHALDPCSNAGYDYKSSVSVKNWLHLHPPTTVSDGFSHQSSDFDPNFGANSCYGGARNTGSSLSPTRPFAYSHNSENGTNVRIESDIYYGQYPSGILDNNASAVPLLAPSEESPQPEFFPDGSGYGLFTSATIPSEVSSQADYSQNLSDFGYGTKWGSLWHGHFTGEQDQKENIGGSDGEFSWKGKSLSSKYGSLAQPGTQPQHHQSGSAAAAAEGFIPTNENSSIWNGKSLKKQAHTGWKSKGNRSFSVSGVSVLPPGPTLEISNPQSLDLASMQAWNPLDPTSVSIDKNFTQLDSSTTNPTVLNPSSTNFPATQGYEPLASLISTHKGTNTHANRICDEGNMTSYMFVNSHTSTICDDGNMTKYMFVNSSPMKDALPSTNVLLVDYSSKGKNESSTSCTNLQKIYTSGSEGPVDSVKCSETFDQLIPAVDSPCWKGAPASQYSPFGISENGVPLTLVDQFEGCNNLEKCQQSLPVNDNHVTPISSPQLFGSLISHESFPQSETKSAGSNKAGSKFSKGGDDSSRSDGIQELRNHHLLSGYPKSQSELKASNTVPNVFEAKLTSDGEHFKGAKQDGPSDYLSQTREPVSNSNSKPLNAPSDASREFSPAKIDTQMLVKTLHNLSEVLLSGCRSNANALKEDDFEVLRLVMENFYKCMLKEEASRLIPGSFSQVDSSLHHQESDDSRKFIERSSRVAWSEIGSSINTQGTVLSNRSPKRICKLHDFNYLLDNVGFEENIGMTQEMEKFLDGNFCEQEDKHPRTILYRDLWIKAEASLCSMKYQLRLAQMKIEMEKQKQQVVKGNLVSVAMDSLGSPTKPAQKSVNLEVKSPIAQGMDNQEVEDMESSVMARFRVLKNRIDNLNSTGKEVQQPSPDLEVEEKIPENFRSRRKSKYGTGQPMKIVNVGFTDTRPWPFVREGQRGDGFGIGSEDLEEQEKTKELGICVDPPLMPSKIPSRFTSPVMPLGSQSSDSDSGYDWEYIPKDLTL